MNFNETTTSQNPPAAVVLEQLPEIFVSPQSSPEQNEELGKPLSEDTASHNLPTKEAVPELPQPRNTVIVMHASVGSGHRTAANAVAQALELLRDNADASKRSANTGDDVGNGNGNEGIGDTSGIIGDTSAVDGDQGSSRNLGGVDDWDCGCNNSLEDGIDNFGTRPQADFTIPDGLNVEVLDVLDFGRIIFDGDKTASMFTGATRPIYDLTWRYTLTGRVLWGGGTAWSRIMFPSFTEHVRKVRPLAIVCTHITAANVAVGARMLLHDNFPIVCVPTDYEAEGLWPHLHSDLFCVANESMAETLRPRKVPDERILITGIPTRPTFREVYDKSVVRKRRGLPQDKRIVLALAGAYLPRPYIHFRDALDRLLPYLHAFTNMHLVFVAGSDEKYAHHLRRECEDLGLTNVTVLDYVEDMAALMAASDLVICKSGGLTVTECLCAKVPMILLGRAYGQEKANVITLTALGAALHVTTWRELLNTLRHIDRHSQSTDAMLVNASFLRRPEAALDIARATLSLASREPSKDETVRRKHFLHFYWGQKPAHIR